LRINTRSVLEHVRSPLYRNSIYLIGTTTARAGLSFVFWVLVARFYTEAEVGWGSAIISAMSLIALLSIPGFNAALIRFLPKAKQPIDMINSCLSLSGIIALVLAGIFIAGLGIWSPALGFIRKDAVFAFAFILFVLLLTLSPLIESVFIARRRAEFALYRTIIVLLLRLPLPVFLALFFRAFGIAASWGIAVAIAFIISIFLFVPRVQKRYKPVPTLDFGIVGGMWRYSVGSYLASLSASAPGYILPIIVVNLLGSEQNAYFYMAFMIASLLFAIPTSVSRSLFAEGAHFEEELWVNVGKSLKFIFLLLVPAVIIVVG